MHLGGGNVEVLTEAGVDFRHGFDIIADALAHDPFKPLAVLEIFGERGKEGGGKI